ncbi:MAG: hypothetical protein D6780_07900 [Candidatus Dadabacteria bacterium]|nr:MAG: hypothetical protein D6780_07900 [Candidatus Dadabacteria bacterium]
MSVTVVKGISQAYKALFQLNAPESIKQASNTLSSQEAVVVQLRGKINSEEKIRSPKEAEKKAKEINKEIKEGKEKALSAHNFHLSNASAVELVNDI